MKWSKQAKIWLTLKISAREGGRDRDLKHFLSVNVLGSKMGYILLIGYKIQRKI